MTKRDIEKSEKSFRAELKRVRKLKAWYVKCKKSAEKRNDSEELDIRSRCLADFNEYESRLLNILDGIQKKKSGDVYFTKDAQNRYKSRPGE